MMLCAINDKKCNYDRVYDTFQQINPEVEKAILYSAHGNGLIGRHSFVNIDLFLDKFLKHHSVFLSRPVSFTASSETETLKCAPRTIPWAKLRNAVSFTRRTRRRSKRAIGQDGSATSAKWGRIIRIHSARRLSGQRKSARVYFRPLFERLFRHVQDPGDRSRRKAQRLPQEPHPLYERDGNHRVCRLPPPYRKHCDCFSDSEHVDLELLPGYGGIPGRYDAYGIITYRVSEPRFEPSEGASFRFDAWCEHDANLKVTFYSDVEEEAGYTENFFVQGGENGRAPCRPFRF